MEKLSVLLTDPNLVLRREGRSSAQTLASSLIQSIAIDTTTVTIHLLFPE